MGKKEILLLATTWMNLEGIGLSEMSDGQTLYDKKAKLRETESRVIGCQVLGMGEMG